MKALLACLLVAASLSAENAPPPPSHDAWLETITVSGIGRVRVAPDRVTFTVGVQTQAASVADAVSENNRRTADVLAALKTSGAKPEEIQTSDFSIFPQQEYKEGQQPRITGYQVTNSISVNRSSPTDASKLLQAAVNAGVNQASGLNFVVSDPNAGRDEGLRKAYADAHAKADLLASAAGRHLGRALQINEGSAPMSPPRPMPMMKTMALESRVASPVPVESGENELAFDITVSFELQ